MWLCFFVLLLVGEICQAFVVKWQGYVQVTQPSAVPCPLPLLYPLPLPPALMEWEVT